MQSKPILITFVCCRSLNSASNEFLGTLCEILFVGTLLFWLVLNSCICIHFLTVFNLLDTRVIIRQASMEAFLPLVLGIPLIYAHLVKVDVACNLLLLLEGLRVVNVETELSIDEVKLLEVFLLIELVKLFVTSSSSAIVKCVTRKLIFIMQI